MKIDLLTIDSNKSIKDSLKKINISGLSTLFVVDKNKSLLGVLTDGIIRRGLIKGIDLQTQVSKLMNTNFISLNVSVNNSKILETLNKTIKIIPLTDDNNIIVDYASINRIRKISVSSPNLDGTELANVTNCINTNWISSQGKYVKLFEDQFSKYHRNRKALAVSNGTVALHLALVSLGIGKGDEVIVPNLTFAASINSILHSGATPSLVDVDFETWNINHEEIEKAINEKTKAIMLVHLYGNPCNMNKIIEIAKKHKLFIVEDCAESLGSTYNGYPLGIHSDAATFSFFGNKTITTGEGGMIVFKDPKVYEKASILRDHGMSKTKRYWHDVVGYNYRLTNIQAAIGVAQFDKLNYFIDRKKSIAKIYYGFLKKYEFFEIQNVANNSFSSNWLCSFRVLKNDRFVKKDLMEYLAKKGIETRPLFNPLNLMSPYKSYAKNRDCKNSIEISKTGMSLPSSSSLSDLEAKYICSTIEEFINILH